MEIWLMSTNSPTPNKMIALIKKLIGKKEQAPVKKKPRIAICVGHSRKIKGRFEGGAVSVGGVSERDYNLVLAEMIAENLSARGAEVKIISEYEGGGYTSAMTWLAKVVGEWKADAAVELHFNAADSKSAKGHEWLYWGKSERSKQLATEINYEFEHEVEALKPRGIKPLDSRSRGALFCRLLPCPAVIAEPFFGTNKADWQIAEVQKSDIADCIAYGIIIWADRNA